MSGSRKRPRGRDGDYDGGRDGGRDGGYRSNQGRGSYGRVHDMQLLLAKVTSMVCDAFGAASVMIVKQSLDDLQTIQGSVCERA